MFSLLKIFLPYSLFAGIGIAIWVSCNRPGAEAIVVEAPDRSRAAQQSPDAADVAGHTGPRRLVDPVCHMAVERDDAAGSLRHGGVEHWFCSLECAASFAVDPDQFSTH